MSSSVNTGWFWRLKGKKLHIYRLKRSGAGSIRADGSLTSGGDELVYPDETISNGIRLEYTAYIEPFVDIDPSVLASDSSETSWSNASLTEVTSPDESSHVNLNRMLSLAVVSYVKAMLAEMSGEVQSKEYYMREFFKKVSDNESNKRMQSITYTVSPFAVR